MEKYEPPIKIETKLRRRSWKFNRKLVLPCWGEKNLAEGSRWYLLLWKENEMLEEDFSPRTRTKDEMRSLIKQHYSEEGEGEV